MLETDKHSRIKLYTNSKTERQTTFRAACPQPRCFKGISTAIWYPAIFLFHQQQQKSKQIHAWALEIPIMSLHLIFHLKKKKVPAQSASTYVGPKSREVPPWSAFAPQLPRELARQVLFGRPQCFGTHILHPSSLRHEQSWWRDIATWSGTARFVWCTRRPHQAARLCPTACTSVPNTLRSWLSAWMFVPENTL